MSDVFGRLIVDSAPGVLHWGCGLDFIAARCMGRQVYLATPISQVIRAHGVERGGAVASQMAAFWVHRLAMAGVSAVAPAVLSIGALQQGNPAHPLGPCGYLDAPFWERWCAPILGASGAVVVPDLAGWSVSEGVGREVAWAVARNVPVFMMAERVAHGG